MTTDAKRWLWSDVCHTCGCKRQDHAGRRGDGECMVCEVLPCDRFRQTGAGK